MQETSDTSPLKDTIGSSVRFGLELLDHIQDELAPLCRDNWEEIEQKDSLTFDPDWERYLQLEEQGYLGVYTARKNGALVGYCSVVADTSLHMKGQMCATNDALYLRPSVRSGWVGVRFLKYIQEDLKRKGIDTFVVHTHTKHPLDKLMKFLEYSKEEVVYYKDLSSRCKEQK